MLSYLLILLLGVAAVLIVVLVFLLVRARSDQPSSSYETDLYEPSPSFTAETDDDDWYTSATTGSGPPADSASTGSGSLLPAALLGLLAARQGRGLLGSVAFSLLFVVIGIGILIFGVNRVQQAQASAAWPSVRGQVIESRVGTYDSDGTTMYEANVTYEYIVGDQRLVGDQVRFGEVNTSSARPANEIVARYPVGMAVDVYYDADDPVSAVLEPGINGFGVWMVPGMGLCFSAAGLFIAGAMVIGTLRGR